MTKIEAKNRIEILSLELEKHRVAYHVNDTPVISDEIYDSLISELSRLEAEYPEYNSSTSPTKRVGGEILDKFEKVTHAFPQWSFDNVFNFEELEDWNTRNKKIIDKLENKNDITYNPSYMCEMKIDGLKVILTYKSGALSRAATRGDGIIGEDITENIKTIKSIPLILKDKTDVTVVGECWLEKSELVKINLEQKDLGLKEYANTRNLAAGTLRQLDPKIVAKRNLKIFAYRVESHTPETVEGAFDYMDKLNTQEKVLKFLEELGFLVNMERKLCKNLKEIQQYYESQVNKRNSYEYGVDGMVIKINENKIWDELGYTAKSPRAGVAYKFPAEEAATIIESVIFQVGRTGAITPVANLRPVLLAGSTVSRATLHNQDEVNRLGVKVHDTVMLRKAGDVIPEIYEVVLSLRDENKSQDIIFPKNCPVCKSVLIKRVVGKEEGVKIFCDNSECEAKHIENLIHFVSKKAINIDGMGQRIVEEFCTLGLITDYASIYNLKISDIENLFGYGLKSAENIISSIDKSREIKLNNFIYSLGILSVGETTAKDLAKYFVDLAALRAATIENIIDIPNMGPVTAKNIFEYFRDKKNIEKLERLLKEIKITNSNYKDALRGALSGEKDFVDSKLLKLNNLIFVITGSFSVSRDSLKEKIEENGGRVSGSVSSKTNYLLAGDNAGSKLSDAEKLNVKIINEEEFLEIMKYL